MTVACTPVSESSSYITFYKYAALNRPKPDALPSVSAETLHIVAYARGIAFQVENPREPNTL